MSAHGQGLAVLRARNARLRFKRNEVIGAFIATPGYLKDQTLSLEADVKGFDAELGRDSSRVKPLGELDSDEAKRSSWYDTVWLPYFRKVIAFTDKHGHKGFLGNIYQNFWGSVYDDIQEFRRQLLTMRASAKKTGFGVTSPEPQAPKAGWVTNALDKVGGLGDDTMKLIKAAVYGGLALGGLFLITSMVNGQSPSMPRLPARRARR